MTGADTVIVSPFRAIKGTAMKRVTQFDFYLLGLLRSFSFMKAGDLLAPRLADLKMAWMSLNRFIDDPESKAVLPNSVAEAVHLQAVVDVYGEAAATGQIKGFASKPLDNGKLTQDSRDILVRAVTAFETALRHELNGLPVYLVEKVGIYDTDALLANADDAIPADLKRYIPEKALADFRKAAAGLVFEMHTACGFHGYRAVDAMLRAYLLHFVGELPSQRDWGSFIKALRELKDTAQKPNDRTVELIDRIRSRDRNPLIHPDADLDATEAALAFDLCRTALAFMAMDMKDAA